MDYYAIGQRIRRIRKARGFSQEQLAEKIDISLPHMSHIETANTKMSLEVFVSLAEALEVPADMLLHDFPQEELSDPAKEVLEILDGCPAGKKRLVVELVRRIKETLEIYA